MNLALRVEIMVACAVLALIWLVYAGNGGRKYRRPMFAINPEWPLP